MEFDINALFFIFKYLSYRDIANFCATNKNLFRLYKKHNELIWETLLLRDFQMESHEILGNPMSYYIGLKENLGNFYSFQKTPAYTTYQGEGFKRRLMHINNITPITDSRAEKIGLTLEEFIEETNNFFQIPAMNDSFPCHASKETIWLSYYIASPKKIGEELRVFAVGKTFEICQRFLAKQASEAFIHYDTPCGWNHSRFIVGHETSFDTTEEGINYKISYGFYKIVLP